MMCNLRTSVSENGSMEISESSIPWCNIDQAAADLAVCDDGEMDNSWKKLEGEHRCEDAKKKRGFQ